MKRLAAACALALSSVCALAQMTPVGLWKTIDDDYHWHIEILPIVSSKVKSYTVKEVYFTPVTPETAAARLREAHAE